MEDKSFDLLSKMYSEMTEQFKTVREDINALKKDVIRIENDHGKKIDALLDGYKQHTDMLERIEKEVTKQEEIIMRRVK